MKNESLVMSGAILVIVISVLSIFLGAIQPLARSQNFIVATRAQSTTVNELEQNFRLALDYPSYIGDEESAKFLSGSIRNYVGNKNIPEDVSRELLNFIEPYMEKDNLRHLMMTGQMYLNMWSAFKHDSDYETAINYYKQARKIGPNVYPVLFGLLSMYNTNGKVAEAKEVGTTILSIWPTDQDTIDILSAYGK